MTLLTLTPYASTDEKVMTKGSGEITVQVQLKDGNNGALLGIYEGIQPVGKEYQEHTLLTADNNLKVLFSIWGRQARKILDTARVN